MSFISSASDNLIAPVNAASGQVLTWNATTGQFEPTTLAVLPNFTANLGLRGDGTNVPVVDARLNFATANAVDIGGTSGLRVSTATAGQIDLDLLGTAVAAGNALRLTSQSGVGSNNNGGNIELTTGATTGSGFSSIRFNVPLSFGTAGATVNAPTLTWQMYTNTQNAIFEGLANNNLLSAQNDKNLRIATFGIGSLQIQAETTGQIQLGTVGTGTVSIGAANKTTTINGLVKQPGVSVFQAQRETSTQAIPANTQTTVIFNTSSLLGTSTPAITLDTTTGVMTFTRTGTFRISGSLAVRSTTANARVGIAFVTGTAVCTATNIEGDNLGAANNSKGMRFEYELTCTTIGTFSIQIGSTAALTLGFNQGTIFNATKTNCIIEERG
jgi:hypothetical protein